MTTRTELIRGRLFQLEPTDNQIVLDLKWAVDEIERLDAIVDGLLDGINQVGVGLFGEGESHSIRLSTWRAAQASWWQALLKAVEAAEAAKDK